MADGALGDVQFRRGAAQAAQAGNGFKGAQGGQRRRVVRQIGHRLSLSQPMIEKLSLSRVRRISDHAGSGWSIDMYFDSRLWRLTAGLRAGMAGGIFLGLLALAAGIARYVFLGQLLARVFNGAPWQDWITPALCVGAMVLLRAGFDHWR